MPTEVSPPIQAPTAPTGVVHDEVDPELLALPDPPRRERSWTLFVLAVAALASAAMAVALRRDALYALASPSAAELGSLVEVPASALADNVYARGRGMLGAAGAVRYERPFDEGSYRLSPVAGRTDLWVEVRLPPGQETARYVPPEAFGGRLVRLDAAGLRHRGLADSIERVTGQRPAPGAWLLVDGEEPSDARWAVALVVLFCAFALWNLSAIARMVRKVK